MRLRVLALPAVLVGLVLLTPTPAQATEHAKRGSPCTTVGDTQRDRSGDLYVCEQRPGDECAVWHAKNPHRGPWPSRSPVDCPDCASPPPSAPPSSAPPSASNPPVVYAPPVAVPQLPVTGPKVVVLAVGGAILVGVGAVVAWMGRRPSSRKRGRRQASKAQPVDPGTGRA